jgi:hypothetical protein
MPALANYAAAIHPKFLLFPALVAFYYAVIWVFAGRDPKPGIIVPQYLPPGGISPAEMRYLLTGASDRKSVAAVLVHLAAQKVIALQPEAGGYRITLLVKQPPESLPREEASAFDALAQLQSLVIPGVPLNPPQTLFLKPSDGKNLNLVASIVTGSLSRRVGSLYRERNLGYSLPAVFVSVVVAVAIASRIGHHGSGAAVFALWFLLFNLGLGLVFAVNVLPTIRDAFRGLLGPRSLAYTFLPLPIWFGIPAMVAVSVARATSASFACSLIALVVVHISGGVWIQKITPLARQRMDQVEGFKQYLASVELDPLRRMNDPRLTPALLSEHLAYAIALDLKEGWGDQLADALFMTTTTAE